MGKSPHFVYPTETILLLRVKINKRKGGYMPLILTENVRTVGGRYDHWEWIRIPRSSHLFYSDYPPPDFFPSLYLAPAHEITAPTIAIT